MTCFYKSLKIELMKSFLLACIFCVISFSSVAQDYFKHYPVSASIQVNGNQYRLNCSVYDSVLQVTKVYNTGWSTQSIIITGNTDGIVAFTFWINPSTQAPLLGYLIYDVLLHDFNVHLEPLNLTNTRYNVVCSSQWVSVLTDRYLSPFNYVYWQDVYRYNLHLHKWIKFNLPGEFSNDPTDIYNVSFGPIPGDHPIFISYQDDFDYYRYEPILDSIIHLETGCGGWGFSASNEDLAVDGACASDWDNYSHDSELHQTKKFQTLFLITNSLNNGIFVAHEQWIGMPYYVFNYDQMLHDWVVDTIYSSTITNIVNNDRVVAYIDEPAGVPPTVFYMIYNPITHSWDKDSTQINGNATGLLINNGTVSWNDGSGLNTRGYVMGSGWGNYPTSVYLYFHLSTFYHEGQPMIHVRNYSIGSDSVYYDFGDGVQTYMPYFHTKWHYYTHPGIYNVCLYSTDGSQSTCQQTIISYCGSSGTVTASADTLCYGDSVQLSLSGATGNIQWQQSDGASWIPYTGPGANDSVLVVSPANTTSYRAQFSGISCVANLSDVKKITVFPDLSGVTLSDSSMQVCAGQQLILQISNSGIAQLAWERFDGTNWVPESATQNGTVFQQTATSDLQMRVIVNSGNCFTDTLYANVDVIAVPVVNSVTGGVACGAGVINLSATGTGNLHWYDTPGLDSLSHTGATYSPFVTSATNFYVQASTGTFVYDGVLDNSIGSTITDSSTSSGMRIYTHQPFALRSLAVYPQNSGNITLSIIRSATGQVLFSQTYGVSGNNGKVHLQINVFLLGNTAYDIRLSHSGVQMIVNNSGFTFPMNVPSGNITILGSLTPSFDTVPNYFNLYDWRISTGCQSSPGIANVTYYNPISATISATGPVSFCEGNFVKISASPLGGYFYSWYRNGTLINGAVNTFYNAYLPGVYTARVSNLNCADTTSGIVVKVPCHDQLDPSEKVEKLSHMELFFNNGNGILDLKIESEGDQSGQLKVVDMNGRVVFEKTVNLNKGNNHIESDLSFLHSGMYIAILLNDKYFSRRNFIKW